MIFDFVLFLLFCFCFVGLFLPVMLLGVAQTGEQQLSNT